ncbi:MAG TPA: selenocysteine-specific translation elongation factor [Gaiellaceae bacterium]|nr:selenocysteine-specific translation elongation factor [Gaiellaceae bacterium]
MPLTVGTAGHIDHGKTWLVRALTGKDTDRLPEERERGISIELGYAPLGLPDGRRLSLVDVPGHERFVRTMVAGATGIDLFLLVVDAAEGARPQTHEHLAILRLLGVERGVVAVTKADAVDAETLELALEEARELVPDAEAVAVSAKTGAGLDELRAALARAADAVPPREAAAAATRLYVDRAFTLHGVGTVATGTLWSGTVGEGDELIAEPAGLDVRVRSVQVHDRAVERAEAGQRVAVSLPGVERQALRRGDALVTPDAFPTSYRLDVLLEELGSLPPHVTVHHGTSAISARLVRVGERHAQLRLAAPVVAARGDRVVLRTRETVGGGTVLDPAPPRRADADRLAALERGDAAAFVHEPERDEALAARGLDTSSLREAGGWVFSHTWLEDTAAAARDRLAARAAGEPLDPGLTPAELLPRAPWAHAVAPLLGLEAREGKLYLPGTAASLRGREEAAARVEAELAAAKLEPVRVDDRELAAHLERAGRLVRLGDGFAIAPDAYERARAAVVAECERTGSVTLARARDLLGTSRRPAQLILERLDADGVTRRLGDERVLRRRVRR